MGTHRRFERGPHIDTLAFGAGDAWPGGPLILADDAVRRPPQQLGLFGVRDRMRVGHAAGAAILPQSASGRSSRRSSRLNCVVSITSSASVSPALSKMMSPCLTMR